MYNYAMFVGLIDNISEGEFVGVGKVYVVTLITGSPQRVNVEITVDEAMYELFKEEIQGYFKAKKPVAFKCHLENGNVVIADKLILM